MVGSSICCNVGVTAGESDLVPGARLTVEERIVLADLLLAGATAAAIGRQLGRHRSTICREIKRNGLPSPYGYRPHAAHSQSCARAPRPKPRKLAPGTALRERVVSDLRRGWSPQQIAGRLAREHPDEPGLRVSHETIYHAWYVGGRGSLRLALQTEARIERSRRSTRDRPESLRGKISDAVPITQRPAEADDRRVPGHWEGDLVIGVGKSSAIATVVERASRFTLICGLPGGRRTAAAVNASLTSKITALPADLHRSLTWDRGKEMARHVDFTIATGIKVYFADPYSPWQRGTNENTNRLIRYYFPRGVADFRTISQEELDHVADLLNSRPRKVLGYRTPAEVLQELTVATTT